VVEEEEKHRGLAGCDGFAAEEDGAHGHREGLNGAGEHEGTGAAELVEEEEPVRTAGE